VALVRYDEERGVETTYCSGVWIGPSRILTAAHCVDPDYAIVGAKGFGVATYAQLGAEGPFRQGVQGSIAWLVQRDEVNDLALLDMAIDPPVHPYAELSGRVAEAGLGVHIVGHTRGLAFTYTPGTVSGLRRMAGPEPVDTEVVQVWSGATHGNSGGGIWDQDGKLLGICSYVSGEEWMFGVSSGTIAKFLSGES
jgi:S1-C subfamily serine protease